MAVALTLFFVSTAAHAQGIITTVAGTDFVFTDDGKAAVGAALGKVTGVALGPDGDVYFAAPDNNMVMKVSNDGSLRVVAGNGIEAFSGDGGPATSASLYLPTKVAFDFHGNLYIVELDRIRKVTPQGTISTVAGRGQRGFSGDGWPATEALLGSPRGLAVDTQGAPYFAEIANDRIRKVTPDGIISTFAGKCLTFPCDAVDASLSLPEDIVITEDGEFFVLDRGAGITKITADGMIQNVFPRKSGFSPRGIAVDSGGPFTWLRI